MDGTLELAIAAKAYADQGITDFPAQEFFNWNRRTVQSVGDPQMNPKAIPPSGSWTFFDGTRSTSIGNATEFELSLSAIPGATGRYRMTWTGVGQDPALRTDRGLALSGLPLTWTANANLTETLAASAGDFAAVVVGDSLLVPDTSTGDAAYPGDPLNAGLWTVIGKAGDSSSLQLSRPPGIAWSGASESFTPSTDDQVRAFSAAGVQPGDGVNVSAGFSAPVIGTYTVLAAAPDYFEFQTSKPLPVTAVAVPGAGGARFFSSYKTFLMVVADRDCHLLINGGSSTDEMLSPSLPGDRNGSAPYLKQGPCWALTVVNDSLDVLQALVMTAE